MSGGGGGGGGGVGPQADDDTHTNKPRSRYSQVRLPCHFPSFPPVKLNEAPCRAASAMVDLFPSLMPLN